tara:strand:+ start:171 stop:338 length:168 start_codon:yes stop_codon:yes gene_type:complete
MYRHCNLVVVIFLAVVSLSVLVGPMNIESMVGCGCNKSKTAQHKKKIDKKFTSKN